jgi:uncharacterized membrane protein
VSLVVAAFFAVRGAWYVFEFAVLELLVVGWAFLRHARHATDRERIALSEDWVLVELVESECARQFKLGRRQLRIEEPSSPHGLICLASNGLQVEVGCFLTECKRHDFAQELRCAIVSNG